MTSYLIRVISTSYWLYDLMSRTY